MSTVHLLKGKEISKERMPSQHLYLLFFGFLIAPIDVRGTTTLELQSSDYAVWVVG
jgi:hypothetical protein